MIADLHTHTTASDGTLSPPELLSAALDAGVEVLAITDHDTVAGIAALGGEVQGLRLIAGVEFSARWQHQVIHVLGLNIDCAAASITTGCAAQALAREQRALAIAARLEQRGLPDLLSDARRVADGASLNRPHFATALVARGLARDHADAFKKYLGSKHLGSDHHYWPALETVLQWIKQAGGNAALAHPAKYKLSRRKLERLVSEFAAGGGDTLEVVSGAQHQNVTGQLAALCRSHDLKASAGSDFHRPEQAWAALGHCELPDSVTPVWAQW